MTPFDFVLVFFMGGIMLTPMVSGDRSLIDAVRIITSIAATHFVLAWLKHRFAGIGRIIDGTPLVLLEKGRWRTETIRKMRINDQDVMAAAGQRNLPRLDQIATAVLERNGTITVIQAEEQEQPAPPEQPA